MPRNLVGFLTASNHLGVVVVTSRCSIQAMPSEGRAMGRSAQNRRRCDGLPCALDGLERPSSRLPHVRTLLGSILGCHFGLSPALIEFDQGSESLGKPIR